MRMFCTMAAAVLLIGGVARADQQTIRPTNDEPMIGVVVICNTSEQAEHYVVLIAGGQEPVPAMEAVNAEARNPRACGVAAVAFVRDATIDLKAVRDKLMQIVRINVVASFSGAGWHRVSGVVQYAVMEGGGETI
ncbi:MAG: hypothetical protein HY848_16050 [Betaproteobacteria bacterium]|nr:hypothetical protein [Betaproteobacteria bacterium]